MTLDEIKALENVAVTETANYVYITSDEHHYIEVVDIPENQIYYDTVEMLRQDEYSDIKVCAFDPIENVDETDASL